MEQEFSIYERSYIHQEKGSVVAGSDGHGIPGVRIDLDAKIGRYLDSLGGMPLWPGRIYNLSRPDEKELAHDWVKNLIGSVLNA